MTGTPSPKIVMNVVATAATDDLRRPRLSPYNRMFCHIPEAIGVGSDDHIDWWQHFDTTASIRQPPERSCLRRAHLASTMDDDATEFDLIEG